MELIIDILSEFFELIAELFFARALDTCSDKKRHPAKRILAVLSLLLMAAAIAGVFILVGVTVYVRSAAGGIALIVTGAAVFTALTVYIIRKTLRP